MEMHILDLSKIFKNMDLEFNSSNQVIYLINFINLKLIIKKILQTMLFFAVIFLKIQSLVNF